MNGYQMCATTVADNYLIHLYAIPRSLSTNRVAGGEPFFIPNSPGHVRRLRPYPPSRRRRH